MKFDNGIAPKHTKSIEDAIAVIAAKGDKMQKFIAHEILESEMLIRVAAASDIRGASGITGVIDANATNRLIRHERVDVREALGEVYITFAKETIDGGGPRGCEGTLVHEGRHAFDFAQTIASFTQTDVNPLGIFDPTLYEMEWEAHKTAGQYMLQINKEDYLTEGLQLMILGELNGKYYVNEKGIKRRLRESYGLEENGEQGAQASEMCGLKMR